MMAARFIKYGYMVALLFSLQLSAQQKPVTTSIDKQKNKIGAQFNLTLKATADTASVVTFPSAKMFGPMEVIRNYKVDTIKKDSRYELVKKYGAQSIYAEKAIAPEEISLQNRLSEALIPVQGKLKTFESRNLFHTSDLPFPIMELPDVFTEFRKKTEPLVKVRN
ncbi:MAG: hypothetical protein EOO48_13080, partial [Flavobacterium sp.]